MKEEALKLADKLLDIWESENVPDQASDMICKLVSEIDRLQGENDALNLELGNPIDYEEWGKHQAVYDESNLSVKIGELLDANSVASNTLQEPVAWMETYKGEPNNLDWDKDNLNYGDSLYDVVPLYTAPKELSDEEILNIAELFWECDAFNEVSFDDIGFARAILKKASEK